MAFTRAIFENKHRRGIKLQLLMLWVIEGEKSGFQREV